jgi:hypothetical protein
MQDTKDTPSQSGNRPPARSLLRIGVWLAIFLVSVIGVSGAVAKFLKWRSDPVPESDWRVFTPPCGKFEVLVPGEPDPPRDWSVPGYLPGTQIEIPWEHDSDMVFVVEYFDELPLNQTRYSAKRYMAKRLEFEKQSWKDSKITSEGREVKSGQYSAWEYEIKGPGDNFIVGRIYLLELEKEQILIGLIFAGRGGQVGTATKFFNSLRIRAK